MTKAEVGGGQQSPKSWKLLPGGGDRNEVNVPPECHSISERLGSLASAESGKGHVG